MCHILCATTALPHREQQHPQSVAAPTLACWPGRAGWRRARKSSAAAPSALAVAANSVAAAAAEPSARPLLPAPTLLPAPPSPPPGSGAKPWTGPTALPLAAVSQPQPVPQPGRRRRSHHHAQPGEAEIREALAGAGRRTVGSSVLSGSGTCQGCDPAAAHTAGTMSRVVQRVACSHLGAQVLCAESEQKLEQTHGERMVPRSHWFTQRNPEQNPTVGGNMRLQQPKKSPRPWTLRDIVCCRERGQRGRRQRQQQRRRGQRGGRQPAPARRPDEPRQPQPRQGAGPDPGQPRRSRWGRQCRCPR